MYLRPTSWKGSDRRRRRGRVKKRESQSRRVGEKNGMGKKVRPERKKDGDIGKSILISLTPHTLVIII